MALRFVAGETPEDAIRAVQELNAAGIFATLDHLGEHTTSPAEAAQSTADVLHMLDLIQTTGVQSNVSVKLTQLGLNLDTDLCRNNMATILARAAQNDVMVRIDMEDTPFTDRTLQIYYELRAGGFANVGMVIQSYLYRSEADVAALMAEGARVRMVKGAYLEPEESGLAPKAGRGRQFRQADRHADRRRPGRGFPALHPGRQKPGHPRHRQPGRGPHHLRV